MTKPNPDDDWLRLPGDPEPEAAPPPANDNVDVLDVFTEDSGAAKERPPFKPYKWNEIDAMADAPWLIGNDDKPVIIGDGLWCNYGLYKNGKTYLSFAEAFSIAYGLPFNGMDVAQQNVAYLIAEGGMRRMRKRFVALYSQHEAEMKRRGIKSAQKAFDSGQFDMIGSAVDLVHFNAKGGMGVDAMLRELGGGKKRYAATFLDTWALMLAQSGGHDSDAETVMPAINGCKRIQKVIGGSVVIVAHVGLSASAQDRPKGLSDLPGAIDGGTLAQKELDKTGSEIFTFTSAMQRHATNGYRMMARLAKHEPDHALEFMGPAATLLSKLNADQRAAYRLAVECGDSAPVEMWRVKCQEAGLFAAKEGVKDPAATWRNAWQRCKSALQESDLVTVDADTITIKDFV